MILMLLLKSLFLKKIQEKLVEIQDLVLDFKNFHLVDLKFFRIFHNLLE